MDDSIADSGVGPPRVGHQLQPRHVLGAPHRHGHVGVHVDGVEQRVSPPHAVPDVELQGGAGEADVVDGEQHLVVHGDLDGPGEGQDLAVPGHDVDIPGVVSVGGVVEDVGAATLTGRGPVDRSGARRERSEAGGGGGRQCGTTGEANTTGGGLQSGSLAQRRGVGAEPVAGPHSVLTAGHAALRPGAPALPGRRT